MYLCGNLFRHFVFHPLTNEIMYRMIAARSMKIFQFSTIFHIETVGDSMKTEKSQTNCATFEENLKKALTELLVLHLLNTREHFIGELPEALRKHSGGVLKLAFPYSAVYRLQQDGYITDTEKRVASDGRRRQFFCITQQGREYYQLLMDRYRYFIDGVNNFLNNAP